MSEEEEGQPLAPRDALAVGEGFQDLYCPLALVRCGSQADGSEVAIAAIVVKEHEGSRRGHCESLAGARRANFGRGGPDPTRCRNM